MSCSRITGICTVANEAQNGHSKSEYSVTSIRAESAPSVKPLNPSLAATGSGALAAGVATGAPREPYQITPPPIKIGRATSELQSQSNIVCRLLLEKQDTR